MSSPRDPRTQIRTLPSCLDGTALKVDGLSAGSFTHVTACRPVCLGEKEFFPDSGKPKLDKASPPSSNYNDDKNTTYTVIYGLMLPLTPINYEHGLDGLSATTGEVISST